MNLVELVLYLVVAGLAGAIGQAIAGYSRGGCFAAIIVGFIGALFGSWLARVLGLPSWLNVTVGGETFPFLWAVIGSALFVALISLLRRGRV
ncbi:MAG: GlsB/YeaQ/YmgE family stress response membrane protein [Chloroflexi bacterium]|nr:GlsB/YeaQ/YmgE family stress response membrane protein [Chloroflexota bacterium]